MKFQSLLRIVTVSLLAVAGGAALAKDKYPDVTDDGLERVPNSSAQVVYKRPGVDFSQYKRVAILDCMVAFRKNWQRDQNTSGLRVKASDMERIKKELADDFREVFTDELQNKGGYQLVSEGGEDVLVLRPAIVNLDVAAPDTMSAGRSRTFATQAGEMTLYVEMFDGMTGEILARVIDPQESRDMGYMQWQTSVSNKAEADRILRKWAVQAHKALDRAHGKQD